MKKRYVVVGLGVAALVAVTIVAVGTGSGAPTGSSDTTPTPIQVLPSGHPSVSSNGNGSTSAPPTNLPLRSTIAHLEAVHARHPHRFSILLQLGDAYFLAQRYGTAGQAYQNALSVKPGNATASVGLAMVWNAQGQSLQAIKAIKAVLTKAPNNQGAHYSLAIVYFSVDRADDARNEWAKAARIDPSSTIGRRSQSFVDLLQGQTSKPQPQEGD